MTPTRTRPRRGFGLSGLLVLTLAVAGPAAAGDPGVHLEGRDATMVVHEEPAGSRSRLNPERAARRLPPCSTFKIPNTLIALSEGVIRADSSLLQWDPARHPRQEWWPASWARDHTLDSAYRNSVLWYYAELARRVGADAMADRVGGLGYGNGDTSSGETFWLSGSLLISAAEQVDFLRRLDAGRLGFPAEVTGTAKRIFVLEREATWTLTAKTGSCRSAPGEWVGWLVGWVDEPPRRAFFAFNELGPSYAEVARDRQRIVRAVLREMGYLGTAVPTPTRD